MLKSFLSSVLLCSVVATPLIASAQEGMVDDSVVTYDQTYFAKFEPVTLLDMLQRVPGVQAIIDKSSSQQGGGGGTNSGGKSERGFGSGGDQILINNKRLSGKANNISDTLQRISASQVKKVELIRGASSELDVQSQGLVVNVVMDEGASTSSTFWQVGGKYSDGYLFSPDILVSHNGSSGNLDYIFGVEAKQGQHIEHRYDRSYTPENVFFAESERKTDNVNKYLRFNANLTYSFENSDELRINGQFEPGKYRKREPRYTKDLGQPKVLSNWDEDQLSQKWELGGDYTNNLDGIGTWKTLFILNRDRIDKQELFKYTPVTGDVPDFRNDEYRVKKEKILRSSLTTGLTSNQSIEIGGEAAINNFDKVFVQETFTGGMYNVTTNDDVAVKENRYEVFANHTYNMSSKAVLQTSLTGEFSKISSVTVPLTGANISRSKSFKFLKPRVDFRYDFTGNDQVRASVERKVSQLDFKNFVAEYDPGLDRIRLGNTGIVPEKSWNYSLTYEHRFPNDAGALQAEFFYRDISDYIELVDFTEFFDSNGVPIPRADIDPISVSGNIPTAEAYGIKATGNIRFGFIGVPEAVFSADYVWEKTDVVDQFSGIHRPFKWKAEHLVTLNFRHDVTSWNMSYGFKGTIKSDNSRHEIDEVASTYNGDLYEAFAEFKIFNDLKLIFKFEHITPLKFITKMKLYNDHIRYNDLSHLDDRRWDYVKEYSVFLQGTF